MSETNSTDGSVAGGGLADVRTPLLYNQWYVAARSVEIGRQLTERTFLSRSVVMYRRQDGVAVALQNRCAHRSYPLSDGWLKGDDIQCRYHGAVFDCDGRMCSFPTSPRTPEARVRRYPLIERGGLIWIWMGDPALVETSTRPVLPFLEDSQWGHVTGDLILSGNYLLMQENLMDLSHIPYLHKESFYIAPREASLPIETEVEGDRIRFWRESSFPGYMPTYMKAHARSWRSRSGGEFVSPGVYIAWSDAHLLDAQPGEQVVYSQRVAHLLTPASPTSTHYWYFAARNYALDDEESNRLLVTILEKGFAEDKKCVDFLQRMHAEDETPFKEVSFASDKPALMMRRAVRRMAQAESDPRRVTEHWIDNINLAER